MCCSKLGKKESREFRHTATINEPMNSVVLDWFQFRVRLNKTLADNRATVTVILFFRVTVLRRFERDHGD